MGEDSIGAALRRCREEAGLTLRDVARSSGVSVNQISQVESGRRSDPAFTTVAKIAAGLRLSLDSISRAIGFATEAPALQSRLTASGRKRLVALRELEDVAALTGDVSKRIRNALKAIGDAN